MITALATINPIASNSNANIFLNLFMAKGALQFRADRWGWD
jgi:hypothetical protein